MNNNISDNRTVLNRSLVEEKRFGMRIFRGNLNELNVDELSQSIIENNIDVVILRLPSEKLHQLSLLDRSGFPYIIADALLYYHVNLLKHIPDKPRNKDLVFVEATPDDAKLLDSLVEEIFRDYKNHYYSNPYFNKNDILEGYKEWVRSYIGEEENGKTVTLVKRGKETIAFVTCSCTNDEVEGVLSGVLPRARGTGVYSDIIRIRQENYKDKGCRKMKALTQIHNITAQNNWSREGYDLKESFVTIHINSLFDISKIEKKVIKFKFSEDDIKKFGELIVNISQINFSDDFAKKSAFKKNIVDSLLYHSIITKYFCVEYPGNGILVSYYSYKFLKPIYTGREYIITISFPYIDKEKGFYKSLVKITDSSNNLCLFAYYDLLKE